MSELDKDIGDIKSGLDSIEKVLYYLILQF